MVTNNPKTKQLIYLVALLISLPLAICCAATQSLTMGVLFGAILAFSIDSLYKSVSLHRNNS